MTHKVLLIYTWFVRTILFFLPDIPVIMRFRGWLYSFGMKHCGYDFQVTHDARLITLQEISVGRNCFIGNNSLVFASINGEISLADEVQIGPHCVIISDNHTIKDGSFRYGKTDNGVIKIGFGSWIGANSTVLKGAILPPSSVLGANSLLNKAYFEENSLYAGSPAHLIKSL